MYGSKVTTGVAVAVGGGWVAVGWAGADWGAGVSGNGYDVGAAATGAATVGDGAASVVTGSEVGTTISVGAETAIVSVAETKAVGALAPGARSVQAPRVTRIRIDRKGGIRFISVSPTYRS